MIKKPPPFQGHNSRIPTIILILRSGFIDQGSTLIFRKAMLLGRAPPREVNRKRMVRAGDAMHGLNSKLKSLNTPKR